MNKKVKKFFAGLLSFVMVFALTAAAAPAKETKAATAGTETVAIGAEVSYTGLTTPGYTFDSSVLTTGGLVGAMVFNVTINLPAEGDVAWNDWCGEAVAVHANGETKYYDFGGAQVGWGVDMNGDDAADTTGVGTASWAGSVTAARNVTVTVPVNAEAFTIDFFDNCWDSATDMTHYTIQSATAVYGTVAATETVAIGQSVSYTGLTDAGYTFDSSVLTTEGTTAYAVFNISIDLPTEGDVAWNDWCGEAAKVTVGDTVKYYDFGGAQVGWGIDMNGDEAADTTGVGTASWAGSAENRSVSAVFPIDADTYTVDFFDNCWDSATDMTHYTVNYATILYGTAVLPEVEPVENPEESGNGPLIGGTAYTGDMTVFLAMQGDVSASGVWDMTWINGSTDVEGVVPTMATNVKAGDTVTIGLSFPEEVIYTWWMAPVVVLNDAEAGTVTTLDYTIDKVTIDGQEVVPDLSLGENAFWYEGTGDWTNTQSIRLKGGYNEWADHYIESPQNYQEVMYTITFGDVVTGQIAGTAYDGEVTMFLAGTAESADQAWDYTWANGTTDNAAITGDVVTAKAGDTVTIGITYPTAVHHTWWLAPTVVFPETEDGKDYKVDYTIDKLVIDGNDVTDKITLDAAADLSWYEGTENHPVTRTIRLGGGYNEWGAGNAKCVEGTLLEGFTTIEYTITLNYIYAEPVVEEVGPMVDKNGTYKAYLGIQSQNYTFRNAWDDGTYGLETNPEVFGQMSLIETGTGAVKKAGTFYDTEIAGNGTYTLEVKNLAWDDGSVDLNLLFISTDIPNSGEITVSNVKVEFDGKQVMSFDEGFEDPDSKDYLKILCINIWNKDLTAAKPMAENLPTSTAKITFEVSGFDYDKAGGEEVTPEPTTAPVEEPEPTTAPVEEPEPTEAPAGEPTTAPVSSDTNNETEGSSFSTVIVAIIVVAVIAVAGGVAFVVLKKKKTSGEE